MFDDPLDDRSDLQKRICRVSDRNPDMNDKQIAQKVGCSASYVSQTLNEYRSTSGLF